MLKVITYFEQNQKFLKENVLITVGHMSLPTFYGIIIFCSKYNNSIYPFR